MKKEKDNTILFLSLPLAALTTIVSYAGIFIDSTYVKESANYAAQGMGQDIANLFVVVPVLVISSFYARGKNKTGLMIWSGAIFYLVYSYAIYSFGLHFNNLFIAYCLILGLSFYAFCYFILNTLKENVSTWFKKPSTNKPTAIFLMIIALLFYFIWLSEIIPAMIHQITPKSIVESGLIVNPVHVLDLAICLPALILTGIFLLKRKNIGLLLAPIMMMFCLLMSIAIIAMVFTMNHQGIKTDTFVSSIFILLSLTSAGFLFQYLKTIK